MEFIILFAVFILLVINTFTNIYFMSYMVLGIVWFIAARIIKAKLKNPDSTAFAFIRIFISLAYFVGLLIVVIVINLTSKPIRFM